MAASVVSPVTGKANTKKVGGIASKTLIDKYARACNGLDVSHFFEGLKEVEIYECRDTGFQFYYPLNLAGDDAFYTFLGKLPWYYAKWRWEHGKIAELITPGMKVLEVGSGSGFFLERIRDEKGADVTGLELSSGAVETAREKGLNLIQESIETHAEKKPGAYDLVCSFQVLEHVPEVRPFLEAQVKCLRPGGTLVIAVPNNDSYIRENPRLSSILNAPPHHTGLWNAASLEKLASVLGVRHKDTYLAPLEQNNLSSYVYTEVFKKLGKSDLLTRAYFKFGLQKGLERKAWNNRNNIPGHSVIAVYEK